MRIGLFGGAFNPVHNGHLALAKQYMSALNLDKLIFIPTNIPPHKTNENLISGKDRIAMLSLAIDDERYCIDDLEFNRSGKSYTYDTILEIQKKYPNSQLFLIIGSDQYFYFQSWYKADEILSMLTVVSASREQNEYEKMLEFKALHSNMQSTIVSNFNVVEVSSSQIRERVEAGESIDTLVPKSVAKYIKEHKLYV